MKLNEESEKVGLKLNIQKTKIMVSTPFTSWQIDGETVETVRDFIVLGSKITLDADYSHEIKRPLLLGRKALTNLDSMLKSRDITLPTKVLLVKGMCQEPARDIPLVTKVMRKEAGHTQRLDRASEVPPDILEYLPPKNQSLPTLLLCALTSDFTGGCPPPPSCSLTKS